MRAVVEGVKRAGGSPFLTETSTLYKGERSNAIDHLRHAFAHGFGYEAIGAPFIMADGLSGTAEVEVPIKGILFDKVAIAREVLFADSLVAVTHATGHLGNGLGAAIKNLGMGLASRMGKLRQHSSVKPTVDPQACTFCAQCLKWCPAEAIAERGGKAFIVSEMCIGCGECLAVCRFDAVRHDWGADLGQLQRREAEHALGAVQDKRDKLLVLSYLTDMTKECDCLARAAGAAAAGRGHPGFPRPGGRRPGRAGPDPRALRLEPGRGRLAGRRRHRAAGARREDRAGLPDLQAGARRRLNA